jgi:putative MATE family efflux protein
MPDKMSGYTPGCLVRHFFLQQQGVCSMDLLQGNIGKVYSRYLFASLGSAVVMSIYSFVDTIAVGQYEGPGGSAAMAVINPLYGVIVFFAILCGIGGSVLMSNAKGEGETVKGNTFFTIALIIMGLLTVLFWIVFAIFARNIFSLFGADDHLMPLVMSYAKWIIGFCPIFLFSVFLACFIRNDGNPGLAMRAIISGAVFNVFGDWFFVFPLGMGMSGAGLATVLGTAIQTVILCTHFFTKRYTLKLVKPKKILLPIKQIMTTGIASGFLDLANVVLSSILNNTIMRYGGATALAVFGVAATVSSLFQALFSGVGQAIQPIVSINFGAGKMVRIHKTFTMAMITIIIMEILFASLGLFFPNSIVRLLMNATPEILEIAPRIIRTYFLLFLCMGINVFATYYLQSVLKTKASLIISFLRGIIISGTLLIILPLVFGLNGVWWAMPISECLVAIISIIIFMYIHKKQ